MEKEDHADDYEVEDYTNPEYPEATTEVEELPEGKELRDFSVDEDYYFKFNNSIQSSNKLIDYKFNEDELCIELMDYIDTTYKAHYAGSNKIQTIEFAFDNRWAENFCRTSILKYTHRYGKKDGYNRKDLLKILHYALLLLYNHDLEERDKK